MSILKFVIIIIRLCCKAQAIARTRVNTHTITNIIVSGEQETALANQAMAEW